MAKDQKVVLNTYMSCGCMGHTCYRCIQNAALLGAWGVLPQTEPAPIEEPKTAKKSKKDKKEDY